MRRVSYALSVILPLVLSLNAFGQGVGVNATKQTLVRNMVIAPLSPTQLALIEEKGELDQEAQKAIDANQLANAEEIARQGVALGSSQGDDLLAEALYLEGKNDEALQEYQKIIEDENGTQPRWMFPYALLELNAGNWSKAVTAYDTCMGPQPNSVVDAHSHFDPNNPQPEDLATAIHIQLGTLDNPLFLRDNQIICHRAMNEFKQALAIEPSSPLAQLYYAKGLVALGKKADAKTALKAVSVSNQGDIKAEADDTLSRL